MIKHILFKTLAMGSAAVMSYTASISSEKGENTPIKMDQNGQLKISKEMQSTLQNTTNSPYNFNEKLQNTINDTTLHNLDIQQEADLSLKNAKEKLETLKKTEKIGGKKILALLEKLTKDGKSQILEKLKNRKNDFDKKTNLKIESVSTQFEKLSVDMTSKTKEIVSNKSEEIDDLFQVLEEQIQTDGVDEKVITEFLQNTLESTIDVTKLDINQTENNK